MKTLNQKSGFTLVEVMVVVGILSFVIVGMLRLFILTSVQAEISGNKTLAVKNAQNKLEEIRNHDFASIVTDYSSGGSKGNVFDITNLKGKGRIYIWSINSSLIIVQTVVCWEDKYGRIIGEDKNLNGQLNSGEDANSNGYINSSVELMTILSKR